MNYLFNNTACLGWFYHLGQSKQGALCDVPRPLRESYQPLIGSPIRRRGGSPINLPLSSVHLPFAPSFIPLLSLQFFVMCRKDLAKQKIALESSAELSGGKCTNPGVGGRHRHGKRILQSSIRPQILHGSIIKYARITST